MNFKDLRDFLDYLEQRGELKRITHPIDPHYEMTEISDRTLRAKGPALLFENPLGYDFPVLTNLFGTPERVAMGMGRQQVQELRDVGQWLAYLKEPEPPRGLKELIEKLPVLNKCSICQLSACVVLLAKKSCGRVMRLISIKSL